MDVAWGYHWQTHAGNREDGRSGFAGPSRESNLSPCGTMPRNAFPLAHARGQVPVRRRRPAQRKSKQGQVIVIGGVDIGCSFVHAPVDLMVVIWG